VQFAAGFAIERACRPLGRGCGPDGEARGVRILDVFSRRATKPARPQPRGECRRIS